MRERDWSSHCWTDGGYGSIHCHGNETVGRFPTFGTEDNTTRLGRLITPQIDFHTVPKHTELTSAQHLELSEFVQIKVRKTHPSSRHHATLKRAESFVNDPVHELRLELPETQDPWPSGIRHPSHDSTAPHRFFPRTVLQQQKAESATFRRGVRGSLPRVQGLVQAIRGRE